MSKLTDAQVRSAKPAEKPYKLVDADDGAEANQAEASAR